MKTLNTAIIVSFLLMLSGITAFGADFAFMVPYDFKNLMDTPRIQCIISDHSIMDSGSTAMPSGEHGYSEVSIPLDAQGNAKGTVQVNVSARGIAPQYIRNYLCRIHFTSSGYDGNIGPAPSTAYSQSQLNHKYKPGTTFLKNVSGTISP